MSKLLILAFATLIVCSLATSGENPQVEIPIVVPEGGEITLSVVFPSVDKYLRETYWYYLRGADIFYQANVNTKESFLYFVIYRNIVGTFLVISTWDRVGKKIQVNTFVRLGNGYAPGSGALYDPVKIDPLVLSLQLGEGEYIVTINEDGTITVIGDDSAGNKPTTSDIEKDMTEKCGFVSTFVTDKYWYYLKGAKIISASHTPTSQRYYCVNVYVNIVGTFLVIGNYELKTNQSGINTFVRLGNGYEINSEANYSPADIQEIKLSPAVLEMTNFGQ
jgi:hypothetical protein